MKTAVTEDESSLSTSKQQSATAFPKCVNRGLNSTPLCKDRLPQGHKYDFYLMCFRGNITGYVGSSHVGGIIGYVQK